ncbi:MAG TPA: GNAT family N-acetyltransferase [Bauldia sp.]|nr:GNAT family N-acetyltransferase [Bauldia sp.]
MAEIGFELARGSGPQAAPLPGFARTPARTARLSLAEAEAIRGEWADLAARSLEANNFFHPDFALPAAARLADGVEVATVRDGDGRLIAAAPVARARLGRLAPSLRFWSHNYGPLGVPLLDQGRADSAVAALLAENPAALVLPDMTVEGPATAAFLRAARRAGRHAAIIGVHRRAALDRKAATGLRAALPTRRRKEYARQMRRLGDSGALVFESTAEPAKVRARFEEFLVLEAAGWKGGGGTALASSEKTRSFARQAIRDRAAANAVRIDSLRLDRRPIAMVVSFVEGDAAWTWKIAYDEKFARFSPGAQVMLDLPGPLFAETAVARIDSLAAPDHPMIDHLWPGRLAIGTVVIAPCGNAAFHHFGLALARAEIRARGMVRGLRDRLKGRARNKETET